MPVFYLAEYVALAGNLYSFIDPEYFSCVHYNHNVLLDMNSELER